MSGSDSPPTKADASNEGLQEFLQNVHGYSEPPSQWQLSQLAAMVGTSVPEDHSMLSMNEANRRVALAAHIWNEAAQKRIEIEAQLEQTSKAFDQKSPLYGPLKIGSHFLPRIRDWAADNGTIPFKHFLEIVVGMAREEDRFRWWRAFLTAKVKADQHRDRWGGGPYDEKRQSPEWTEPEDFPIDESTVPKILENQKLEGFQLGFIASMNLEEFRSWRLRMKSPTKKADVPISLEDAQKKGLDAEKAGES